MVHLTTKYGGYYRRHIQVCGKRVQSCTFNPNGSTCPCKAVSRIIFWLKSPQAMSTTANCQNSCKFSRSCQLAFVVRLIWSSCSCGKDRKTAKALVSEKGQTILLNYVCTLAFITSGWKVKNSAVKYRLHFLHLHKKAAPSKPHISCKSVRCNWRKHATTGLYSSGDASSGVMNHALPSGNLMDEPGF